MMVPKNPYFFSAAQIPSEPKKIDPLLHTTKTSLAPNCFYQPVLDL